MSTGITPLTPEQTKLQEKQAASEGYFKRILIGIDQDMNVDTGGLPDETMSSRAARDARQGKWLGRVISRILDIFQENHGAKAQAGDAARAEKIIEAEVKSGDIS